MRVLFLLIGVLGLSVLGAEERELFAFQNGMPKGSFEEEAEFLKEAGYAGISQVHANEGGKKLEERVAVYEKAGLRVLSIYLPATKEPVKAEVVKGLADRGGMIELTVSKIDEGVIASIRKTAAMAEKLKIKVALYPHAGFAVATMPQAMDLVAKVEHANLGVMFNLCHFLKSEKAEDLEKVLEKAGNRLFAVSTCGADTGGKSWGELIQTLEKGTFPQARLFKHLKKMGFTGPVALQCYAIRGDKKENLRKSMQAWRGIE